MTTADDKQRRHDVPGALGERLDALRRGTQDGHEWHQAGVLVAQLATSAFLVHGRKDGRAPAWDLLRHARELYMQALRRTPAPDTLAQYAIMCDDELALAFTCHVRGSHTNPVNPPARARWEAMFAELVKLPPTPARTHQLAIAYGFAARAYCWQYMTDGNFQTADIARDYEKTANRLFEENAAESPDGQRAYCSHLLAMALLHHQLHVAGWRKQNVWRKQWAARKQRVAPAFMLALRANDFKQVMRAVVIGALGTNGERWARSRRDKPEVIQAVLEQLNGLLEDFPDR